MLGAFYVSSFGGAPESRCYVIDEKILEKFQQESSFAEHPRVAVSVCHL